MIFALENKEEYESLCKAAWELNSEFWDRTRIINPNIANFVINEISSTSATVKVADVGCGNGWLLKKLIDSKSEFEYCGIDSNKQFINVLNDKYLNFEWHCLDFTKPLNVELENRFDIVVSCLSIIEMADLTIPFQNFNKLLSENGIVILITLNPYFEIVRLNNNYRDLENDMSIFRSDQFAKYYKKEIIIEGQSTGNFYYGVLHSLTNLNKSILVNNFSLKRFEEINFFDGGIEKPIYHGYIFKKNERIQK